MVSIMGSVHAKRRRGVGIAVGLASDICCGSCCGLVGAFGAVSSVGRLVIRGGGGLCEGRGVGHDARLRLSSRRPHGLANEHLSGQCSNQ